jgi:hypothetical protein
MGTDKKAHVRAAMKRNETFDHHCHWPDCGKKVPPALWGCKTHWFKLPKVLRDKIWSAYEPGQEADGTPSKEYLTVATEVQKWIAEHGDKK